MSDAAYYQQGLVSVADIGRSSLLQLYFAVARFQLTRRFKAERNSSCLIQQLG
jgi:hypothetical protein